ncbi:hypothetical protein REC12_18765 [Desulfosporosinus sp. PR]|uniref:hypothetical protein n=1 Tax=Candidatus Desulfosporosinus nitrosoreducens TaxID=3401928 RepID=UPI0027F5168D|nr:hypothetical protein [Desulfosporosinus sp. PR]MDQ7095636.1 hypothetical protein [Desulfosporosinus sp. PR]
MMVNCKACDKEIAKGVKKCVHCGKDQRNFLGRHKIITGILAIIVLIIIVSAASGGDKSKTASAPAPTPISSNATQPNTSTSTPTPPATPSVKTYSAGMYKIGTDMPAGEYVLIADDTAYFQTTRDSTGSLDSIIANDNFVNQSIITVKDGQYLTIRGCKAYAFKDSPQVQPVDGFLPEGMYKVGFGLSPGEYKVSADADGYAEVSSDSSHSLDSIVSNDNFQGDKYITVKAGQYLKLNRAKLKL